MLHCVHAQSRHHLLRRLLKQHQVRRRTAAASHLLAISCVATLCLPIFTLSQACCCFQNLLSATTGVEVPPTSGTNLHLRTAMALLKRPASHHLGPRNVAVGSWQRREFAGPQIKPLLPLLTWASGPLTGHHCCQCSRAGGLCSPPGRPGCRHCTGKPLLEASVKPHTHLVMTGMHVTEATIGQMQQGAHCPMRTAQTSVLGWEGVRDVGQSWQGCCCCICLRMSMSQQQAYLS